MKTGPRGRWGWLCLGLAMLAGCGREQIRVYTAPKDVPPSVMAANEASPTATEAASRARPQISWKLPAGWTDGGANGISMASFRILGGAGKEASVSITEMDNWKGREAMLVNMWRSSGAGLGTLSEDEAVKQLHQVDFAGEPGLLFEVSGTNKVEVAGKTNDAAVKIITAILHDPDGSWFCKLSGDPAVVDGQRPAFLDFIKSISFIAATPPPVLAGGQKYNWKVPGEWKAVAAGDMQVARFSVPEKGGAKADVFVSVFPSDTGGMLANINRWRRQVNLGPVEEPALKGLIAPLDPANPGAVLVDLSNGDQRLIGSIVPRQGTYWFYKLSGSAEAVAPEKESFVEFVKSTP